MPKTTTKPTLVKGIMDDWKSKHGTLTWAHDMTAHSFDKVTQLESIARMIASATPAASESAKTDRHDMRATMELFAENLNQIRTNLDEVMVILQHLDPKIKVVNE